MCDWMENWVLHTETIDDVKHIALTFADESGNQETGNIGLAVSTTCTAARHFFGIRHESYFASFAHIRRWLTDAEGMPVYGSVRPMWCLTHLACWPTGTRRASLTGTFDPHTG